MTTRDLPLEVDNSTVKQLLEAGSIVLIDCREEDEFHTAHIQGAVLMPMSQWTEHVGKLQEYSERQLVVVCHHGMRSLRVTHWLRQNGFPEAQSMRGGIDAWSIEIDAQIPRY